MIDDSNPISRRRVLRNLGIAGFATGGFTFVSTGETVAYQQEQTYQTEAGVDLRVEWTSFYNGELLAEGDDDAQGPALTLTDVLPGDEGTLAFSIQIDEDEESDETDATYEFLLRGTITDESENGITEPERNAGDTSTESGELGDYLQAEVWYDQGVLGGCNGELDFREAQIATGSLRAVASSLSSGIRLASRSGEPDCYGVGDAVCLGIHWWLPESSPDVNVVQGDSVTFDLGFGATEC